MLDFFRKLFESDFMPHGSCFYWKPEVLWLHVVSDGLTALAYYLIPIMLIFIVRRRRDLAYPWMFLLFGVFILSCGTTHLIAIYTLWTPVYRLEGVVKAITALSSVPTALLLVRLAPKVLLLPSPGQLREANARLEREVAERKSAEVEVRVLNDQLEKRVAERTRDLQEVNDRLVEAMQRHEESEARMAAILDASPTMVYLKDLDGKFLFVNRQLATILEKRRDEVVGTTDYDYFPPAIADTFREHDRNVVAAGEPAEFEETTGAATYLTVKFPLKNARAEVYALCGISLDITERQRTRKALETYTSELEDFAHAASHDLQEPLRTVRNYTQLIARRYRGQLDADADVFIDFVTGSVERMRLLLAGLLDYSYISHTAIETNPSVNTEAALSEAIENLTSAIRQNSAKVTFDRLPSVTADGRRLVRLFQNLIANAIRYRSAAVPEIHVSSRDWDTGYCLFQVRDNGIGIAPEYRERVFGLFRRLHGPEYEGTGIGLAICKKIVESSGGSIWVESPPEGGSVFCFTLPCASV